MIIKGEEIFVIPANNKAIVYAPLRRFIGLTNEDIGNKILNEDNDTISMLINRIIKNKKIELDAFQKNYPITYDINLSDNCQLKCIYCYNSSTCNKPENDMPFNYVKALVTECIKHAKNKNNKTKSIKFGLFGGAEPTYNRKLFVDTVNFIKSETKKEGLNCILGMTTNGCYDTHLMDFILENFSGLTFSIDGPKFIHNAHRPTSLEKDSFDIVFENAKKLYKSNILKNFRVTISKISLENWQALVDFFIDNFPSSTVTLAPLLPIGRGEELSSLVPTIELWEEKIKLIYTYARGKINLNLLTIGDPINLKTTYCGVGKGSLWIMSKDGSVVSCAHNRDDDFKIGTFSYNEKKFIIDENKVIQQKNKYNIKSYVNCVDCFCKYTCCGGCPSQRKNNIPMSCEIIRELTAQEFYYYLIDKKS